MGTASSCGTLPGQVVSQSEAEAFEINPIVPGLPLVSQPMPAPFSELILHMITKIVDADAA